MDITDNYKYTKLACYVGYIVQAIIVNFAPLLFVMFNTEHGVSLEQLTFLSGFTFIIQITVDILAGRFADRIGYRELMIAAQLLCAIGIAGYGFFPFMGLGVFFGLVISTFLASVGGGLIEVLVSPIIESCPADSKSGSMALLHSFYCWGQAAVVILSTVFFAFLGIENWRILALLLAFIPFSNGFLFLKAPIKHTVSESESMSMKELFSSGSFKVFLLLMMAAGASELAVSQWVSAFAEAGLNVSKTVGDLLGLCLFAFLMGGTRVLYTVFGKKIELTSAMLWSGALCIISYLLASLAPHPILNLFGCALCGVSVAILWPGTLSLATKLCPKGGTLMFGLLALGGDLGCVLGTGLVGTVSGFFGDNLKVGILSASVFPIALIVGLIIIRRRSKFVG